MPSPDPEDPDSEPLRECYDLNQGCQRVIIPENECPDGFSKFTDVNTCREQLEPVSIAAGERCTVDRGCRCSNGPMAGSVVNNGQVCSTGINCCVDAGTPQQTNQTVATEAQCLSSGPDNYVGSCETRNCFDINSGCSATTLYGQGTSCDQAAGLYSARSTCEENLSSDDVVCWNYSPEAGTCVSSTYSLVSTITSGQPTCNAVNISNINSFTVYASAGECVQNITQDANSDPNSDTLLCYNRDNNCNREEFAKGVTQLSNYTEVSTCERRADFTGEEIFSSREACYGDQAVDCFNAQQNCAIESFSRTEVPTSCVVDLNPQPQRPSYFGSITDCKANLPDLSLTPGGTCPSVNGCVCATGPDQGRNVAKGERCAEFKADDAECTNSAECRSGFCYDWPDGERFCQAPPEDDQPLVASCAELGDINVQFRSNSSGWQEGRQLASLDAGDSVDVNCFVQAGQAIPSELNLDVSIEVSGQVSLTFSGQDELRGFEVPENGQYQFSCQISNFASCGDSDTINVGPPPFSCRLWVGGNSVGPGAVDCRYNERSDSWVWQKCAPPHNAAGQITSGEVGLWSPCGGREGGLRSAESLLSEAGLSTGRGCPAPSLCVAQTDTRALNNLVQDSGLTEDEQAELEAARVRCSLLTSTNACIASGVCEFGPDGCVPLAEPATRPFLTGCDSECTEEGGCSCRSICAGSFEMGTASGIKTVAEGETCGGRKSELPTPPEQIKDLTDCNQACLREDGCTCPTDQNCARTTVERGFTCEGYPVPEETLLEAQRVYDDLSGTTPLATCTEECQGDACRCQPYCLLPVVADGQSCGGLDPSFGAGVCAAISSQSLCEGGRYPYCAWDAVAGECGLSPEIAEAEQAEAEEEVAGAGLFSRLAAVAQDVLGAFGLEGGAEEEPVAETSLPACSSTRQVFALDWPGFAPRGAKACVGDQGQTQYQCPPSLPEVTGLRPFNWRCANLAEKDPLEADTLTEFEANCDPDRLVDPDIEYLGDEEALVSCSTDGGSSNDGRMCPEGMVYVKNLSYTGGNCWNTSRFCSEISSQPVCESWSYCAWDAVAGECRLSPEIAEAEQAETEEVEDAPGDGFLNRFATVARDVLGSLGLGGAEEEPVADTSLRECSSTRQVFALDWPGFAPRGAKACVGDQGQTQYQCPPSLPDVDGSRPFNLRCANLAEKDPLEANIEDIESDSTTEPFINNDLCAASLQEEYIFLDAPTSMKVVAGEDATCPSNHEVIDERRITPAGYPSTGVLCKVCQPNLDDSLCQQVATDYVELYSGDDEDITITSYSAVPMSPAFESEPCPNKTVGTLLQIDQPGVQCKLCVESSTGS